MSTSLNRMALRLFAPIAPGYERWAAVLSLGQDPRWRAELVGGLGIQRGSQVLDVAAGTGAISRLLESRGAEVLALDQSREMLAARRRPHPAVRARAERLPFADGSFDGVTFGYLLRYVEDPAACLQELGRVLQPGGTMGMLDFGRPRGLWGALWWLYTRAVLPALGTLVGSGWRRVGQYLGPSIDAFHARYPSDSLLDLWRAAGLDDVRLVRRSLGGGLIAWGRKP